MRSSTVTGSAPTPKANPAPTTNVVIGSVDKTELSPADIVAGDGEVVRDATKPPKADAKQHHWFEVTKGGFFGHDGLRTRIAVGKTLSDAAYNIDSLRKQGIVLKDLGMGSAEGPPATDS